MNIRYGIRIAALSATALLGIGSSGCAVLNVQDRDGAYKKVKETIHPETTAGKIAMYPVGFVGGYGAIATDVATHAATTAATHPFKMVPKAWDDTRELYWKPRQSDYNEEHIGDSLRESIVFLAKTALTPPTVAGAWAVRTLFDPGEKKERHEPTPEPASPQIRESNANEGAAQ